jgi:hypothetical protein
VRETNSGYFDEILMCTLRESSVLLITLPVLRLINFIVDFGVVENE